MGKADHLYVESEDVASLNQKEKVEKVPSSSSVDRLEWIHIAAWKAVAGACKSAETSEVSLVCFMGRIVVVVVRTKTGRKLVS